ncbi:MAG TPA: hypothetical protein H9863_05245 [Candidatus Odoribacter faecigallinarum]|uniref:Uncharacterized protein n=1 Tax=Candidatus Odoribacter faecigallinarum TaxID=2838706 RepID=A0A9D1UZT8_9BACT|nr:hypothetical protein [Candidatus Odoribacter faecigallinarum]
MIGVCGGWKEWRFDRVRRRDGNGTRVWIGRRDSTDVGGTVGVTFWISCAC